MTEVYTSNDSIYKDRDAAYQYYDYGPLARTEIGEYNVQGDDYIYTINGWLKGMNSNSLSSTDAGKDATTGFYSNNINIPPLPRDLAQLLLALDIHTKNSFKNHNLKKLLLKQSISATLSTNNLKICTLEEVK